MAMNGLLVLSRPLVSLHQCLSSVLRFSAKHVRDTLYVHITPQLTQQSMLPSTSTTRNIILQLYTAAASSCSSLDVRILLGNVKLSSEFQQSPQTLSKAVEVILSDSESKEDVLRNYVQTQFSIKPGLPVKWLDDHVDGELQDLEQSDGDIIKNYSHVCLGGTFDRIHTGHKILLTEALIRCAKKLTVGVTDVAMIQNKTLWELIEPTDSRIQEVKSLIADLSPSISSEVVAIQDPFGPSIVYPDIECLVVSQETLRGGEAVNKRRREKGMADSELYVIDLVEDACRSDSEEEKISSSSLRRRTLGDLRKPALRLEKPGPYLIGLTGGIASGKSSIRQRLEALGAGTIDCDLLGHTAYEPGNEAYEGIIQEFGQDVTDENGRIDRAKLGAQVFGNEEKRQKLNGIVWPAVEKLAWTEAASLSEKGYRVVFLEAALLLDAGWADKLNEVWVTIIPKNEAVVRIKERNGLTEEEAVRRVESQPGNKWRVDQAHVVLSTLWSTDETQRQVEKAWGLLQNRLS